MSSSAVLYGADHEDLGQTVVREVSPTTAIAISCGRHAKNYDHIDPNEDVVACHSDSDRVVLVVADGHNGRESSGEAVAAVECRINGLRFPPSRDAFVDLFWDAHEAVLDETQRPGARTPDSRTALAVAVVGNGQLFWASMGDCDIFLCDRTIKPLGPHRSYFLGWQPMTRAELAERLEIGTATVPDGATVVVASDGLHDFAHPLTRGRAQMLSLLTDAPDAAAAARGLVELACDGGAGDNVAVGLVRSWGARQSRTSGCAARR